MTGAYLLSTVSRAKGTTGSIEVETHHQKDECECGVKTSGSAPALTDIVFLEGLLRGCYPEGTGRDFGGL